MHCTTRAAAGSERLWEPVHWYLFSGPGQLLLLRGSSSSSWSRWCQKWSIKQRSQTNLSSSTTLISRCLTAPQSLVDQSQAALTLTSLAPMTAGDVDQWRCWFKWNNCFCHLDEYCIVMTKWSLYNMYSEDPQEAWGQLLLVPAGRWKTLGLLLSSSRLSELVRLSFFYLRSS